MNKKLSEFARTTLISGLNQLPKHNIEMFARMYSHKDLNKPTEDIVNDMADEDLDWAMQQVERTLKGK